VAGRCLLALLFDYSPRLAASLVNISTITSFFVLWIAMATVLGK
jgi:predicted permease